MGFYYYYIKKQRKGFVLLLSFVPRQLRFHFPRKEE